MAVVGSGNDIIIQIPNKGDRDWADLIRTSAFQRLVEHDHTGTGRGRPINTNGLANDSVNDLKILLRNNEWLRSAGQPGDPDQNILRVSSAGDLEIAPQKLVMSNGVIIDNNGPNSSRIEGEITISDDLIIEGNILGPDLIQTSVNGLVTTKNVHIDPSDADPVGPMDGQIQYSDGTHRTAGLWQYQGSQWINIQGEVGANSVNTVAIQNLAVTEPKIANLSITEPKMANDSVPTRSIIDGSITLPKFNSELVSSGSIIGTGSPTELSVYDQTVEIADFAIPVFTPSLLRVEFFGGESTSDVDTGFVFTSTATNQYAQADIIVRISRDGGAEVDYKAATIRSFCGPTNPSTIIIPPSIVNWRPRFRFTNLSVNIKVLIKVPGGSVAPLIVRNTLFAVSMVPF